MAIEKEPVLKSEQETVIVIDPVTKQASLYTCIPSMIKRAQSFVREHQAELVFEDKYGIEISFPSDWVKISKPRKVNYTDEQKEALRNRLASARAVKSEQSKKEKID